MNTYSSVGDIFANALQDLWSKVLTFLPNLLVALVIFFIGLAVASALGNLTRRIVRLSRVDSLLQSTGVGTMMSDRGLSFSFADVLAWIVKWFFIVVVLIVLAETLGWTQITDFLNSIVLYIPNVIIAIIILGIGLVGGQFLHDVVERAVIASRVSNSYASALASVAKWSVTVFALFAALVQLGIAESLIQILFTGMVAALALAFGLGGKDKASQLLDQFGGMMADRR